PACQQYLQQPPTLPVQSCCRHVGESAPRVPGKRLHAQPWLQKSSVSPSFRIKPDAVRSQRQRDLVLVERLRHVFSKVIDGLAKQLRGLGLCLGRNQHARLAFGKHDEPTPHIQLLARSLHRRSLSKSRSARSPIPRSSDTSAGRFSTAT